MTIEIKRSQRTNRSTNRYDYDVYDDGVHVATWSPKSWGAKGYVLYDAVGEIVRPLRHDTGLPMVTNSIDVLIKEEFVSTYLHHKKAVPTAAQIAEREARRAADKEVRRLNMLEFKREERIRDAALELYSAAKTLLNNLQFVDELPPALNFEALEAAIAKAEGS